MVVGERNALAEVGDHPFIVSLVTTYKDANNIYFLLDPALGGELFELYSNSDGWFGSEPHTTFYITCTAIGLDHMHSKRLVHRDIKLENILLDERGYARITDLGIAKIVIGKTYTVCGTADYLAPETLKQSGHNRAVDWWALGVLVFVCMCGRLPFEADDVMETYKNIVKGFRKEHFPNHFSADLVDLIKCLCKKKPQERLPMLSGGLASFSVHPWFDSDADAAKRRWETVQTRTANPVPYEPPQYKSPEERRAALRQDFDTVKFDPYVDDGTNWDAVF